MKILILEYLPMQLTVINRKHGTDSKNLTGTLLCVYIKTGCGTASNPFNKGTKRVLALTLCHLNDSSVLGSLAERYLTGEMFGTVLYQLPLN